jgi:DNA-binding HxlR family transcriptional regulator
MAGRTYGDRCGIARALDVVGDRWALLVVRELLLGPKRFTDVRAGLPAIGPDVLSQRLRELEHEGVLRRETLAPPAASRVYELTERGRELEPVILALGRWGSGQPLPASDAAAFGSDSAMLALKTLFAPPLAAGFDGVFEVRLGDDRYSASVAGGQLQIRRGPAAGPRTAIACSPVTLAAVLWHGRGIQQAIDAGELSIDGDRGAAERFLGLFPLDADTADAA